jgi:3-hydroxyanthranilate 3,4-dioxygenase
MAREHMFFAFDEAAKCGPYDERPMLPADIDLQIHLSRNDRPQPFHLICQHDTVLVVLKGEGAVEYRGTSVVRHGYEAGDFLYVPAGTPHRIVPRSESVHLRYKLPESDLEGVAWFCAECGAEVRREVWELGEALPQEGYLRACREFNGAEGARRCPRCGAVHPPVDLGGVRWEEVAHRLRAAPTGAAREG